MSLEAHAAACRGCRGQLTVTVTVPLGVPEPLLVTLPLTVTVPAEEEEVQLVD